jgi:hypothetical protein
MLGLCFALRVLHLLAPQRNAFLTLISGAFDLFSFRAAGPTYALAAVSVLTGVAAMLVFRYTSNQSAMRRIRNRVQAHILEVRLFPDQLGVVSRAYLRALRCTLLYLVYTLQPVLILLLPMLVVLAQLNLRFSLLPLRPGDSFILKAKLTRALPAGTVSLRLPNGLALTAPPVHIPALSEVDWRIRAKEKGNFSPAVIVGNRAFTKQVVVASDLRVLYAKREQRSWLDRLANPGERTLPAAATLRAIDVSYARRSIRAGPFETVWWVFFLVVALASGLIAKFVLKVEL